MSTLRVVKPKQWRIDHPDEPILEFSGVSFNSDGKSVLHDISFKVDCGETRILLGRTGSGKSVILKLANGLLRPDFGMIRVFGKDLAALHQSEMFSLRQDIGMVFQERALFDSLSVRDNVAYQLIENRVPAQEIRVE